MAEQFVYDFDGFSLNPFTGVLLRDGQPTQLRAKPFELLLVLVENGGRSLSKEDLINRVWSGATVTDTNFHVNLDTVRKALGETGRNPRFILRTSGGYKFVGDVKKVAVPIVEQAVRKPDDTHIHQSSRHLAHVLTACGIYAALYSEAVFLEVAYDFDHYGWMALKIAPIAFVWMLLTSFAGLELDRRLISKHGAAALGLSLLVFFGAAAAMFAFLNGFLPAFPITQAAFQTYSAQAAYLKDTAYFLVLAFLFLILPLHFVVVMEHELKHHREQSGTISDMQLAVLPKGTIYPRFWALASLLVVFAIISLVMTAHLLDNLKPAPHENLFSQLVYFRGFLYFGLGIDCLLWYRGVLNEIRRDDGDDHSRRQLRIKSTKIAD